MSVKSLFKSDIERLKRASPVKTGKRFASFFIDFVIVIILSFLVFLIAQPIVESNGTFKRAGEVVTTEVKYYNDLVENTHIVEFIDKENSVRKDDDIMVIENVNRAIYQSYLQFGNEQEPRFQIEEGSDVTKYGRASLETDNIAYFYTQYVPNNGQIIDYEGRTPIEQLYYLYGRYFTSNSNVFFTYDTTIGVPTLGTRVAYSIYHYLYVDDSDTDGQLGKSYYETYYSSYSNLLSRAEEDLIRSEPYYTEHYLVYRNNYATQANMLNVALIISIVIGYLIGVLLPKILFKDEKTVGRKLLGLGMITKEDEQYVKIPIWLTLVKSIAGAIGFITTAVVLYMFPPFTATYAFMSYTMFSIGSLHISFILLITIISCIAGINACIGLFTHYKQSGLDLLSRSYLVDTHYLDDSDLDDIYEGKPA